MIRPSSMAASKSATSCSLDFFLFRQGWRQSLGQQPAPSSLAFLDRSPGAQRDPGLFGIRQLNAVLDGVLCLHRMLCVLRRILHLAAHILNQLTNADDPVLVAHFVGFAGQALQDK